MPQFEDFARHRADTNAAPADVSETIIAVRRRAGALARAARTRDLIETTLAFLMLPLFVWLAFRIPYPVSKAGAVLVAAGCVVVPVRLRQARGYPVDPSLPVSVALEAARAHLQAQARLLRSVLWWYLVPLLGGVMLLFLGAPIGPLGHAASVVVVVGSAAVLHRANAGAARRHLDPLIVRLTELSNEFAAPDSGDHSA